MMKHAITVTAAVFALLTAATMGWSASTLQDTAHIPMPGVKGRIDHLAADTGGKRLFVAALGDGSVEVIDVEAQKVVQHLTGLREPQGVLVTPGSQRLIVTDGESDHATIFDPAALAPLARVPLPEDGDNVRLEAATGRVWVGAGSGRTSALIAVDPASGRVLEQIALAGHPESFQLEQQGVRIFVNVPTARSIQVVDRREGKVIADWSVPGLMNFPMALDEPSKRLFVATRTPARLVVYDTASGNPVATLPTVSDADDVFYDAQTRRVYLSGGEGSVQVFQQNSADSYTSVEKVATRKGARTCYFVPQWRKLFVALPQRGQEPAEVRVFSVAP
jgi:DNA-binding beta-propeller fold protein YncE